MSDPDFDRTMCIAETARLLRQRAHRIVFDQVEDGIEPTPANLRDNLIIAVATAQPRSSLVSWFLPDRVVEAIIEHVAVEIATAVSGSKAA